MVKYNLNYNVTVELADESALDIIESKLKGDKQFIEDYMKNCIFPYIKESSDGKKYLTLPLWEIMHYFGDKIYLGCYSPIKTDIYLEKDKLYE